MSITCTGISPDELLIGDHTPEHVTHDVTVDDEVKARGLIPRDYEKYPVGCYASAPGFQAVDMPMIPQGEWSERIRDKVATKSQISDIRMTSGPNNGPIPSQDQNGKGFCETADTEVLTEKGWVKYPDYDWSSPIATVSPITHRMEFQVPFERHVYEYDGPMIYSTNRRIDFGVTPDHQMYVRKWDEKARTLSKHYSFVRAADLGWYVGLLPAPSGWLGTDLVEVEVPGDRRYDGDDFMALLGLIVSDGYAGGSDSTRNWVSFCCFREELRPAVDALAARTGFRQKGNNPNVYIRYNAGALAEWIRRHCYTGDLGSRNKRVPGLVKEASTRQIKHFLTWFNDRIRNGLQYYSTSRRLIDDLQELFLRTGKRSSIGKSAARDIPYAGNASGVIHSGEGYTLTVGEVDRLCIDRKKHLETDRYKGLVYCAGVPNHTLITRRNGSVLVSSNCWAHSTTGCVMMLRAVMGEPYVGLSAYAVACVIKHYKDEGGWGAQSLDFITERGVPSEAFWAMRSMDRGNDNAKTWENAKLHRVTQGWVDLQAAQYDRKLTFDQVITCLLSGVPVIGDFNWWGHSVGVMDAVDGSQQRRLTRNSSGKLLGLQEFERVWGMDDEVTAGFGIRIWNSWGDSWSSQGTGVLAGSKAIPDGGAAPRVTLPSPV